MGTRTLAWTRAMVALLAVLVTVRAAPSSLAQAATPFPITPLGGSGITGSGTVTPGPGAEESTHTVQWQGLTANVTYGVSQYHGTNCASYDVAPEFVFPPVTADSQGKAAARIVVPKPFANWPRRPHFVILHAGPDPSAPALACGMIVAAQATTPGATPAPQTLPPTGGARQPIDLALLVGGVLLMGGVVVVRRMAAAVR